MDVTEDVIQDTCMGAVFERDERYCEEGRIHGVHRIDTTVAAIMSDSRQYDVRVDLAANGFAPWCDCPYDGPGTYKHVVAVLFRCVDDPPQGEGDRLGTALNGANADELRAFLREELTTDANLHDQFLARVSGSTMRSVDEPRTTIDRRFEETNLEYYVASESIDFTRWFDPVTECREQEQYASVATVYHALVESLDDNMERADDAYDHFSRVFSRALDKYVDCIAFRDHGDAVTDAIALLDEQATSRTSFLTEHLEEAVVELQEKADEQSFE